MIRDAAVYVRIAPGNVVAVIRGLGRQAVSPAGLSHVAQAGVPLRKRHGAKDSGADQPVRLRDGLFAPPLVKRGAKTSATLSLRAPGSSE